MISLKILDVKSFMSNLLIQTVFDPFLLTELDIATFTNFSVKGRLNQGWYNSEELESLDGREYAKWSEIKPIAYQLIKGNKTPLSFKIVFLLSKTQTEKIINQSGLPYTMQDVGGFFVNVRYENGEVHLITGVSMKIFTLDKSLEQEWDRNMQSFLKHYEIAFEI